MVHPLLIISAWLKERKREEREKERERERELARKVRFRYLAKLEFIKHQTRIMLSRTLRNRTRVSEDS